MTRRHRYNAREEDMRVAMMLRRSWARYRRHVKKIPGLFSVLPWLVPRHVHCVGSSQVGNVENHRNHRRDLLRLRRPPRGREGDAMKMHEEMGIESGSVGGFPPVTDPMILEFAQRIGQWVEIAPPPRPDDWSGYDLTGLPPVDSFRAA